MKGKPGLLFLDGHPSRLVPEGMKLLKAANITVVTFISHSTHIFQPLDRIINNVFKNSVTSYIKRLKDSIIKVNNKEVSENESKITKASISCINAFQVAATDLNITECI